MLIHMSVYGSTEHCKGPLGYQTNTPKCSSFQLGFDLLLQVNNDHRMLTHHRLYAHILTTYCIYTYIYFVP